MTALNTAPRYRTKHYTARGIQRIPCHRCGGKGYAQWNACAENVGNKAVYRVVCKRCDVELNVLAMIWMHGVTPEVIKLLEKYALKVLGNDVGDLSRQSER